MNPLIPYTIQENYLAGKETGQFEGYTMFVDMSGFTPLTEALLKRGTSGAEELSNILQAIFEPMVCRVYERGGYIPYFAGDAFTAIFPGESCQEKAFKVLQTAEDLSGLLSTARTNFPEFPIGVKVGLGYGEVLWGIVGDTHHTFYYRGKGIEQAIASEKKATQGEIVFDENFCRDLGEIAKGCSKKIDDSSFYLLKSIIKTELPETNSKIVEIKEGVASKFLPKSVIKFNGRGEFRTVVTVFISFEGVSTHEELDAFMEIVLKNINSFSGYFKEIDFSDKGGVLLGFFGAPVSYENNSERALEFLTTTFSEIEELKGKIDLKVRAGVTSGVAYAGLVGGKERCQYAAVGNMVNLAARLMINADWGEILAGHEIQKDRNFKYKYKGEIRYKGFEEPIATYKLVGKIAEQAQIYDRPMVGREKEIEELTTLAEDTFKNKKASIAYAYGEAGIGKSRLAFELKKRLVKGRSLRWMTCRSDQILRKPFNPFIYFLKNYFEQSPENSVADNRRSFERRFQWLVNDSEEIKHPNARTIQREIVRTKSVLAALIDIKIENSIWENLDARGRYQNTMSALTNLFFTESIIQPTVLELEDGHWYDEDSKELLKNLIPKIKDSNSFILVTSRYDDEGKKPKLFSKKLLTKNNIKEVILDLNILNPMAMKSFAEERLKGKIDEDFSEFLQRTTNGNPFYLEQILEYFIESNLLQKEGECWTIKDKNVRVSSSINAVLTARIDRLSTLVKETVKAAAVIGREFELPVLTEVMKMQTAFIHRNGDTLKVLREQVQSAERGQIWQAMNELRYIFRHSLLREAVYEMQLGERLRELHKSIAQAIEKVYAHDLEPKFVDLAFHYEQAEEEDKTLEYLEKAADLTRDLYQNQQAIGYYDKLLAIQNKNNSVLKEIPTLLKKGSVLELIGQWEECEKIYDIALTKARMTNDSALIGRANNSLGYLLMLRGNYEDANMYLEAAAAFFEASEDNKGISKVYGNLGNLYFRQGSYEDAKSHFIRSIQMSEMYKHSSSNAMIVANLGLTYMNLGHYEDGIRWQLNQLEICKQVHDRQGMATLFTNLGIVYFEKGEYDDALECYEKGLELSEELGNKLLLSILIGSLGRVYERKGDYDKAMELYEDDLKLTEELGDKQGISIALGLIGELKAVRGEFLEGIRFMVQNLTICEELGYQKGIAKALNTLGDIYYYSKEYEKAIDHYDRAIKVTKGIGNKLVLGASLLEKATVLAEIKDFKKADKTLSKAVKISDELGNPDLIFDVKLMQAKVLAGKNQTEKAQEILTNLLESDIEKGQEAAIYFEFSKFIKNSVYHQKALNIYQDLYEETPHILFKIRIEKLEEKVK